MGIGTDMTLGSLCGKATSLYPAISGCIESSSSKSSALEGGFIWAFGNAKHESQKCFEPLSSTAFV